MVLRPGPKVFFQYELRFVNRLKSQLLISHLFLPIKQTRPVEKRAINQAAFWEIFPPFWIIRSIFVSMQNRAIAAASWFNARVANAARLSRRNYRTHNLRGTAGRSGQSMVPV